MKKVLAGIAIGAGLAYVVSKLHKQGKLDNLYDDLNELTSKAKKNIKNIIDVSENQAEYIKDRIDHEVNKHTEE